MRSKSFEGQTTEVEEWYSTKYSIAPFSEELKKKMTNPSLTITSKKLDLPPPNNLIPKNFDILAKNEDQSAKPKLVKQWDDTDLWYKKDDKFERPKASVNLKFFTQDCDLGLKPESRIFVNVWQAVQKECMREFNYNAECATLQSGVAAMHDSINFSWSGFNDSMPNFIDESITRLLDLKNKDLSQEF